MKRNTGPEKCGQYMELYLYHTSPHSSWHDSRHSHALNTSSKRKGTCFIALIHY
jgi:hypothetical protein